MVAEAGEVVVKVRPEFDREALSVFEGNLIEKVDAGAALVFALYHADAAVIRALPTTVLEALERAQKAYQAPSKR